MPRHDWNTSSAHSQKPHHKAMHSAAHGRGGDRKLKAVKRILGAPVVYQRPRRDNDGN